MATQILSVGVVVLRWDTDHYKYLLLKAYNYWDFPKGMMEKGESPFACALREVEEETTITQLDFRWGKVYRQTQPYNHGRKIARYYIAATQVSDISLPINPALGRPEHSAYCWATRQQAWPMLTPRVQAILRWSDDILAKRTPRLPRHAYGRSRTRYNGQSARQIKPS